MTVLTNITFANYPYTPPAAPGGLMGQSVWFSMPHRWGVGCCVCVYVW